MGLHQLLRAAWERQDPGTRGTAFRRERVGQTVRCEKMLILIFCAK